MLWMKVFLMKKPKLNNKFHLKKMDLKLKKKLYLKSLENYLILKWLVIIFQKRLMMLRMVLIKFGLILKVLFFQTKKIIKKIQFKIKMKNHNQLINKKKMMINKKKIITKKKKIKISKKMLNKINNNSKKKKKTKKMKQIKIINNKTKINNKIKTIKKIKNKIKSILKIILKLKEE